MRVKAAHATSVCPDPKYTKAINRHRIDSTKPDGTPRKLMDSARLHAMGWNNARSLLDGVTQTYADWQTQS